MEPPVAGSDSLSLDPRLLSQFIGELSISRRHVTSYPANHPVIVASMKKVVQLSQQLLLSQQEFTVGIAKDCLMVGNGFLDRRNPANLDFAHVLFGHGIAAVTFIKGISADELLHFNGIISNKRAVIREQGGLAEALQKAGVMHIQVEEISYVNFRTTEDLDSSESADGNNELSPWATFVQGLLCGTLDPTGARTALEDELDPAVLAALLNERYRDNPFNPADCLPSLSSLMSQLHQEESNNPQRKMTIDKVTLFVSQLTPDLRRTFLTGTFSCLKNAGDLAEDIICRFSDELLYKTLEDVASERCYAPPFVLKLLGKISTSAHSHKNSPPTDSPIAAIDDMAEKLRLIFREDTSGEYVPLAYRQALQAIVASESCAVPETAEKFALMATLNGHVIETQASAVILEILRLSPDAERVDVLEKNLSELCRYFLEMGDYAALTKIYSELEEPLEVFTSQKFMEEVLRGPGLWGKGKYLDIQLLIQKIGAPFAGPLLNHLAEENNMSLRRFFIDRVTELSDIARDEALTRLRDPRWFFVRNLLIILRSLDDPSVVRHIKPLLSHPHPKVHQEALKTLLHFRDPGADRLLLSDLENHDDDRLLVAVQLAEYSRNPAVKAKLLALVKKGGVSSPQLEIKLAAIRSLAEFGNGDVLPELERILCSRNFFFVAAHNRLKMEILRSIDRYPYQLVKPILETVALSGVEELARTAADQLKVLRGRGR